jgi:site-specific DNA-methyltransferase (adenine-specific)
MTSKSFLGQNRNKRLLCDGLLLLNAIQPESISACFFDPQYRQVMDKMHYGNEGRRQKERALLPQMPQELIEHFILLIADALKPGGYLFFWCDKHVIAEGIHLQMFDWGKRNLPKSHHLARVDMLVWNKGRIAQGYRLRNKCEFMLVFQKPPKSTKTWKDHGIPDDWPERIEHPRMGHPHKKPFNLTTRLIECVTRKGDYILDPCAGSFLTLDACLSTGRNFIGGDISPKYGLENLNI